jgi:GMP synthase PP-ATPase subunit
VKQSAAVVAVLPPMLLATLLNMYVANCSVNGNCRVYAWLIAVLAVVSLLSMAASVSLLKTKPTENNVQQSS